MSEHTFSGFPEGARVRVTEGYIIKDSSDPDDNGANMVGIMGTVAPGNSSYIRVRLDGNTHHDLFLPHELEVVTDEQVYPDLTLDALAEELYNLIVVRGRWGGKPGRGRSVLFIDDGSWATQPAWVREIWREFAETFAKDNRVTLV